MGIECNWHLGDLDLPDGDPMQEIIELQSRGTVVNLSADELQAELNAALAKEGRYSDVCKDGRGQPLGCEIKWQPDHILVSDAGTLSCFTCPHHTADRNDPLSLVCRVGRRQEEAVVKLRAIHRADSLDTELAAIFAPRIEACAELAEAMVA